MADQPFGRVRLVEMVVEGVRREAVPELGSDQLASASRGFHVEIDRHVAIQRAVAATRPGDVLIIAGKGHEDYQIIGTTKRPFDDRHEVVAAFRALGVLPDRSPNGADSASSASPNRSANAGADPSSVSDSAGVNRKI